MVGSHPVWVRGLKQKVKERICRATSVAPRVGAWIETLLAWFLHRAKKSHPVWVRGLKQGQVTNFGWGVNVAPRVGAWIETAFALSPWLRYGVAPRVGAWIETK